MTDLDDMFVSRREFDRFVKTTQKELRRMEASQQQNQASIDAETAKVQATQAKLVTIQQEVDALKQQQQQGQTLDFSALDAALAQEDTQADTDVTDAAPPTPPTTG